jgi:hypothetical protein
MLQVLRPSQGTDEANTFIVTASFGPSPYMYRARARTAGRHVDKPAHHIKKSSILDEAVAHVRIGDASNRNSSPSRTSGARSRVKHREDASRRCICTADCESVTAKRCKIVS